MAEKNETALNEELTIDEPNEEEIKRGERAVKDAKPKKDIFFDLDRAADSVARGVLTLKEPIYDGAAKYTELEFDFTLLKGIELARALDFGDRRIDKFNSDLSDVQALNYFACAAAKCQPVQGGLDAQDIRERIGGADAIKAIQVATCFFRFSSLAGDRRFRNKSSQQQD